VHLVGLYYAMTLSSKAEISNDISLTINGTASRRPNCNYVPPSCGVTPFAVVLTYRGNTLPLNQERSFRPAMYRSQNRKRKLCDCTSGQNWVQRGRLIKKNCIYPKIAVRWLELLLWKIVIQIWALQQAIITEGLLGFLYFSE